MNPEHAGPVVPAATAYRLFSSPGFLASIALLAVNDFLLKPVFHNWVTGKLSDVAGLFAFAMFWMILLPSRRTLVCLSIAGLFAYWKSPHSDPLLDWWNSLGLFAVGRTVDYSDLLAVPVVGMAHRYYRSARSVSIGRLTAVAIGTVSVVVFVATTFEVSYRYDRSYPFSIAVGELRERLDRLEYEQRSHSPIGILPPEEVVISIPWEECSWVRAYVRVAEAPSGSRIRLLEIIKNCPGRSSEDRERLLRLFETSVIDRLRESS